LIFIKKYDKMKSDWRFAMLNADLKEFEVTSEFDKLVISGAIALPTGEVTGILQIVHGMCEHKERYYTFMDYLAGEGFITVIHDCRGHGKSICTEEDRGFLYKDGGIGYVADIEQIARTTKKAYPDTPYFMLGHSMGSLGARVFIKEYSTYLNGLIICGSPSYSRFSGFVRSIESAISKKLGSHYRSEKIAGIMQNVLNKPFLRENLPNAWICSDREVVENFNADPMCNFTFTLNGYEALLYLLRETYSKKGWEMENPHLPIRFLSGRDDPCMESEKKFFKSIKLLEQVGYENISHRLFDGMRHEILNEKNNTIVYKDIAKTLFSWIDRFHESLPQDDTPSE
jgi:alpha-beta hydrolase superfamily lysophospholipase